MEDSHSKKKRAILDEDDSGLELSLGLSCGGSSSNLSEKKSIKTPSESYAQGSLREEERVARLHASQGQGFWLDPRRKALEAQINGMMQLQQSAAGQGLHWDANAVGKDSGVLAHRLRQLLEKGGDLSWDQAALVKDDISAQQIPAAAWGQFSKQAGSSDASKIAHPSGIPMSIGLELAAKYLGGKASVSGNPQQPGDRDQLQDEDSGMEGLPHHESLEQQKKFQEARKKRKMLIDEQKLQKKAKDDEKSGQDGPENVGLPLLPRVSSLGNFQNRGLDPVASSMAALSSQLMNMRRTISDPTGQSKEDGSSNVVKESSQEPEGQQNPTKADEHAGTSDEAKNLLEMWQLGSTLNLPPAENINPELSSTRPGMVAGQIGGTGSSPDLPWVSATGSGPNGKTISGVVYKMSQGQFRIVCACHGLHMSPSDFVKHAGQLDASSIKGVGGDAISVLSQVTSA